MDCTRGESYEPLRDPGFDGVQLSRVMTPADAVDFVNRFGFLNELPFLTGDVEVQLTNGPVTLRRQTELRERYQDIETAATTMRMFLRAAVDIQKAIRGDARQREEAVLRLLSTVFTRRDGRSDEEVISEAAKWLAQRMTGFVDGKLLFLAEPKAGRRGFLRTAVEPTNLSGMCFFDVANKLTKSERFSECEDCRRAFIVRDGRQRFCDATCANRARFRSFKERHPDWASRKRGSKRKAASKQGRRTKS